MRAVSPGIYAIAIFVSLIVTGGTYGFIYTHQWFRKVFGAGELFILSASFLVAAILFIFLAPVAIRFWPITSSFALTHAWRCSILYFFLLLGVAGFLFVLGGGSPGGAGSAFVLACCAGSVAGVIIDLLHAREIRGNANAI